MTPPLRSRASACGKVILLGEHAVVYGIPAVAAGLPGGLELRARPLADRGAPMELSIPAWDVDLVLRIDDDHSVARAALEVLTHCDGPVQGWRIEGETSLPARAGLGSSAALTVALARLVLGQDADLDTVVEASLTGERVFHGEPSGIDSQVAARGGVVRFVRGEAAQPVRPGGPLPLVVIPSRIPRSTVDQVARVRQLVTDQPRIARPVLEAIAGCVDVGISAIERNNLAELGEVMSICHELLSALGVSIPRLDALCSTAREAGALGAKLTGAGGGGCAIAVVPDPAGPIVSALEREGVAALTVTVAP